MEKKERSLQSRTSFLKLRTFTQPKGRLAYLRGLGYASADLPTEARLDAIENGIGALPVPLGVATNFIVNGEDCLVTMATEERTVVAAASSAAKLCHSTGGFTASVGKNTASGQVLFTGFENDAHASRVCIALWQRSAGFRHALQQDNPLRKYGCGRTSLYVETFSHPERGAMVVLRFDVEVGESMGAKVVLRVGDHLARMARETVGREETAVICTNASHGVPVTVTARWPGAVLGDKRTADILDRQAWAEIDERRAVTHNKGIMNGVSAVCLATGQDVRAVEAAAHFAALMSTPGKTVRYMPLTAYRRIGSDIEGTLRLTIPLGTVGSAALQPAAVWCRALMGANDVARLAAICGAVGLAQNFAALRSIGSGGILASHQLMEYDAKR